MTRKIIEYDNRRFLQVTERSAMRITEPYRVDVLRWEYPGGEVQCRNHPVTMQLYETVKSLMEGIV
jgi:hypothetical protein